MASPRDARRLAFQTLFQLDARGESEADSIRASVLTAREDDPAGLTEADAARAFDLALAAFRARRRADADTQALAPTWPAPRQPAVDRAIIRLAHYEMTATDANPKVVVNDAVELAKQFSTERSPAFVNGVLDKILKRVLAERALHRGGAENAEMESEKEQ